METIILEDIAYPDAAPDNPPPNPIGEGDIDWQAAMLMLSRALRGFPPPEDCVWAPPGGEAPATELWRHAGAWGL